MSESSAERLLRRYVDDELIDGGDAYGTWDDEVRELVDTLDTERTAEEWREMCGQLCQAFLEQWSRADTVDAKFTIAEQIAGALMRTLERLDAK